MKRLAVITTHPIQYYAPVFARLAQSGEAEVKVFYTWGEESIQKFDPDFGKVIQWDIPVLEGYSYTFLTNTAADPGTHHFKGIVNPQAIKVIKKFQPDAILVYGWSWQSHLKIIRHFSGKIPVWFRGDSTLLDEQKGWKTIARSFFLRWLYRHIDKAFYVGTRNKAYFEKFGLKAQQLVWAPHSVDNGRFAQPQMEEAVALRKRLGIPAPATVVLFAGKLEPKKDPLNLLQAFAANAGEDSYLLIVGNGVLENTLKTMAEASPARRRIRFLDFQNQGSMPALYQCCNLFCLPSVGPGETWGLAINEVMAAGKAVLVSDKVGCAVDLVQHGINGEIFKAGNADELGKKLASLTSNPKRLAEMGEASRRIIENWSLDKQTAIILDELKNL